MRVLHRSVAILAMMATISPAYAACQQSDLQGTWQSYSSADSTSGSFWVRCKLKINSTGGIANAPCFTWDGTKGTLTNGSVSIVNANLCTFKATFRLFGSVNRVKHGTLAPDGTTGTGVGTFPKGIFLFTLVKIN